MGQEVRILTIEMIDVWSYAKFSAGDQMSDEDLIGKFKVWLERDMKNAGYDGSISKLELKRVEV